MAAIDDVLVVSNFVFLQVFWVGSGIELCHFPKIFLLTVYIFRIRLRKEKHLHIGFVSDIYDIIYDTNS